MTVVTDDFNRPDGAVGSAWTMVPTGDGTPTWSIVSDKVRCTTVGGSFGKYARHDTATGSDDMYAQAVTSSTQANGSSNTGVLCRGQTGATNSSYQFTGRHAGDLVSFWRILAGTETKLRLACNATAGTQDIPAVFASGATIREEVVGSLIRGLIDGVLVGVARDISGSAVTTGQRGGLNGYNNAGGDLVELDDFEAGPLDDKLAPFVAGVGEQSSGTTTTSTAFVTPASAVPANIAAGDLLVAHVTSRDNAQTVTAPGSEGWSAPIENPSQTGLEDYVFAKVWGLGQTDDTTPTFSIGAGTSGWAVTFVIWRNPLHATNPWTSVTDAIVASASQTTTVANATVTAPSVTDTGTHRTIVRFFSSADDNSLGLTTASLSNSEGALVYGGLDFDTIAGLDMAQAMSTREDVTTAGAIGTATVVEHLNGTDVNNGITLVLGIPTAAAEEGTGLLDGGGALSGTGTRTVNGTGTLAGGGSATSSGTRTVSATASLSGGGSLSATGVEIQTGSGALSGGGVLAAAGLRTVLGQAAATGGGTLTASGTRTVLGSAALTGDGALSATGVQEEAGAAALDGGGALSASGVRTALGSGALTGGGTLTASGTRTAGGVGTLAGGGTLEASGQISGEPITGSAALDGGGSFTGSGTVTRHGQATLIGGGGLAASGQVIGEDIEGEGALTGAGTLSATGVVTRQGAATLSGGGALVVVGRRTVTGSAVLDGGGSLTASGPAAVIGTVRYLTRARPVVAASSTAEPTVDMEVTLT